ncbi:hypothetical protein [Halorubrum coriense]|uniref:hypothetical protein n=1 Tax=Halorubrum coriense TaxID=64713 RepID=UPI001377EB12|nr:hypothetical protein [Halorubrum coriense]
MFDLNEVDHQPRDHDVNRLLELAIVDAISNPTSNASTPKSCSKQCWMNSWIPVGPNQESRLVLSTTAWSN